MNCKECNIKFENIYSYMNHMRWKHKKQEKKICEKCNKEFKDVCGYSKHIKTCNGISKIKKKWICPLCNYEIKTSRDKHLKSCNGKGPRRIIKRREGGQKWAKGKTYEELYGKEKAKELKEKMGKGLNFGDIWNNWTEERKEQFRNRARIKILKRYENGWMPKAGRCKKIKYQSPIAGETLLDGSWELLVAQYLDKLRVNWIRNKKRFKYKNLKGKESHYIPDFYVKDWKTYIEVKGYETKLDECKWKQFKEPLEIWRKSKINEIKDIFTGSSPVSSAILIKVSR